MYLVIYLLKKFQEATNSQFFLKKKLKSIAF